MNTKKIILVGLISLIGLLPLAHAQNIEYVNDEECGCELVYIDGIQTTRDGDLFGFKRYDGTVIVEPRYKYVDQFHNGYCRVYTDETHAGLIDSLGNEIIPCLYNNLNYPREGRILVLRNDSIGYYNLQGQLVIPLQFPKASDFSEGRAAVVVIIDSFSFACTFIDTLGRQVFPPIYQHVMPYLEGYSAVRRYDRWGLIDTAGKEVLPCMYELISTIGHGCFFAGDEFGTALFDYSMKPLTPFVYTWTAGVSDRRIAVRRDGKYGFLDLHGNEVIPCQYDEIGLFSNGRALASLNGHYGIIDTLGRIILPIEYDDSTTQGEKYIYHDGLALVEKNGKVGYVDLDGNLAIPFYFQAGYQFSQGLAPVKFNGLWGYIDRKGEVYMPFVFQIASPFAHGRAEVVYNGTVSKVDLRGKCVKNCKGVIAWRDWTK